MYLINGNLQSCLPLPDRGLQYGDGLFETIAVKDKQPLLWDLHMARLLQGCERLNITKPDQTQLLYGLESQLKPHEAAQIIKITITRGQQARGYRPQANIKSTCIISQHPWPSYSNKPSDGVSVRLCETPLSRNPRLAGIKHLNRLEQVLAQSEWNSSSIQEGIMLDLAKQVISGTMTNLFLAKGETLLTPGVTECGIAGILRQHILNLAQQEKMDYHITSLTLADLQTASEIFLCNSVIGIWPVSKFIQPSAIQTYTVGRYTRYFTQAIKKVGY